MKRLAVAAVIALAALIGVANAGAKPAATCGADICIGDSWQAKLDSPAALDGILTLEAGTHPGQQIQADPTRLQPVTFVPVGGPVYVSRSPVGPALWLGSTDYRQTKGPSNLTFRGIHFGTPTFPLEVFAYPGTTDVTFDNDTMGRHNFTSVTRVTLENSDIGPWHDAVSFVKNAAGQPLSLDVKLLHNHYHDNTVINPANHAECEYNWGTRNLLIEGNVIENCTDIGIFAAGSNPGITILNNFIDSPMPGVRDTQACNPNCGVRAGYSIQFKADASYGGIDVRYNSVLGAINTGLPGITGTVADNIKCGQFSGCPASQFANVFQDPVTTDGTMDLHLVLGAPQIDAATTPPPAEDIDGQARPIGPTADIGADEFGTLTPPPPPPPPPPPDNPPLFNGGLTAGPITTTVLIGWKAATDDVLLKGYRLYRDGTFLSTAGPLAVHAKFSIACGTHVFKVEAYDSKDQRTAQTISLTRNC